MATLVSGGNSLSFSVCQESNCAGFSFNETTGIYTAANSGGWGGVNNFAIADAVDARIIVEDPDGTVLTTVTIYPTFPDSTTFATKLITTTDLGLTGNFVDGLYSVTYEVDILNVNLEIVTLTVQNTVLFTCTIKCCVDKLVAKVAAGGCNCESDTLKEALLASGLYEALLKSGACGNLTNVENLLETLTRMCASSSCGCS